MATKDAVLPSKINAAFNKLSKEEVCRACTSMWVHMVAECKSDIVWHQKCAFSCEEPARETNRGTRHHKNETTTRGSIEHASGRHKAGRGGEGGDGVASVVCLAYNFPGCYHQEKMWYCSVWITIRS